MKKLFIVVTVPVVLETWLKGQAKFLSSYYDVEIITSDSSAIDKIKQYENVKIKIVDFNRKINLLKDLKVLFQLSIYFGVHKPDFVYTLTPKAGLIGMIASWLARVPHRMHSIVGLPHLEATGKRRNILATTERITYYFASNLYCNSFVLKQEIERITHKRVQVIGHGSVNGVDTEVFQDNMSDNEKLQLLNALNFTKDDFVITFVGRIVKDKGINELVDVFNILSGKFLNIKLLLIGDYKNETDPISDNSKNIIKNNKHIKYLEFQDNIKEYLSITDLFVLPSYREGLPNVLIEAGSYGIPLVATNINGCNEVVEHNVNGLLVQKKDKKDLQCAIEKFIEDKSFYESIKRNVRDSIVSKYDQNFFWKELLCELKKIESNK